MLPQPIRHAWRSLRRTPVFTLTAALTLVLGVGAVVAIFAVVNGVLLRPLPYGEPDRLVGAWHDLPPLSLKHIEQTQGTYFTYQRLARTIDGIGVYQQAAVNVSVPGGTVEPQRLATAFVSHTLLPVMRVRPLLGRTFTEAEDVRDGPRVVVISEGVWRSRFGADPRVIGRTLEVNGRSAEIVGVMPASFRFPDAETQIWHPLGLTATSRYPGGFAYRSVARLKPGVTPAEAQREFAALLERMPELFPEFAPGMTTRMMMEQAKPQPVLVPLRQDMTGAIAGTLWMVAAAAALVLLVACANVTNLILVRADGRQRELAVREALGAGRARVLLHFLGESAVLAMIAAAAGLGLAALATRALVALAPAQIPRLADIRIDATVVGFSIAVAILVALICSAIPALRLGRVHLSNALRDGGGRGGTSGKVQQRVRAALVAAQIAVALVVLAGSGLLWRTFQRLHDVRPGFDAANLATFWLSASGPRYAGDSALVRFYAGLAERIEQLPGVQAAGVSSRLPLMTSGMNHNPLYPEDDPSYAQKVPPLQLFTTVDDGYFDAMRIPLVAGRTFDRLDRQQDGEAVVSLATAIQFWRDSTGRAAVGKRFRELPTGPWFTVIGVVGSVRDTGLAAPPTQATYFPQVVPRNRDFGHTVGTMALVVRTAPGVDPATITGAVQRAVRELDPSLPLFRVRPMQDVLDESTAQLSFVMLMLAAAAVVTLVLGAIGLYGVMAYVVTLRTRELGVRIALGAQPRAVAAMLARQGIVITALGVTAGLALFALVARFLEAFLFGVAPTDPVSLLAASSLLLVVAMLASWVPARRAASVDPAEALRAE